ncbi:MAG: hypothetical protein QMD23_07650 [Candidatus Bathyarchaeia archaeon]|nr:hypothetical protein [Candidatus Bathyarchaeia archaeon]
MPFRFVCSECGAVLYEDPSPNFNDELNKHLTYIENVIIRIGGKCSQCGRKLTRFPVHVEVYPLKKTVRYPEAELRREVKLYKRR